MITTYEIRTIAWYTTVRRWALFRNHLGIGTCLFTARTREQCVDYLRTMRHQRRLP